MDIVEGFKIVGSVAGLISGAFLLYDRFVRGRPIAYLAKADAHGVDVALKNAADETLIVDEIRVAPNVLGLAGGHEIRDIVPAIARRDNDALESKRPCFFPIEPFGELRLAIVTFDPFNNLKSGDPIVVSLKWRNTRFALPFDRKVTVRTTAGYIRKFKGEHEEE